MNFLRDYPKSCVNLAYTYTCDNCEKNEGVSRIYSVHAPEPLIKHIYASPSLIADVITQKYVDGVPLVRQEKIWLRDGFELSRATMANWMIKVAEKWLKPLCKLMKKQLLEGSVIYADETVIQVLKEEGKMPQSESRMWVYGSDIRSGKAIRIFEYQPDRTGERCKRFLNGFKGYLVSDGYTAYNALRMSRAAAVGRICAENGATLCRMVRRRRTPKQRSATITATSCLLWSKNGKM